MGTRELRSGLISVVEPTFLRNYFLDVNCHFCKIFIAVHLLHYPVGIICVNLSWMNRLCWTFFHFMNWRLKCIQFSSELHIWRSAFVIVCCMKQPKKCNIRLTGPNVRMPKKEIQPKLHKFIEFYYMCIWKLNVLLGTAWHHHSKLYKPSIV